MLSNTTHLTAINSPVRQVKGKVELYSGSTLSDTYTDKDYLTSFTIDRVGEGKFFGYGVAQKINIKLIDTNRQKNILTSHHFKVYYGAGVDYICPYPTFYVTEVNRNENTNELSITAYDLISRANDYTVSDLTLPTKTITVTDEETGETSEIKVYNYTIEQFVDACASLLNFNGYEIKEVYDNSFDTLYEDSANFEGTETIKDALNAVAEATQTIYYLDATDKLVFK